MQSICPGLISSALMTCVSSSRGAAAFGDALAKAHVVVAPRAGLSQLAGSGASWACQSLREPGHPDQIQLPELRVWSSLRITLHCIFLLLMEW